MTNRSRYAKPAPKAINTYDRFFDLCTAIKAENRSDEDTKKLLEKAKSFYSYIKSQTKASSLKGQRPVERFTELAAFFDDNQYAELASDTVLIGLRNNPTSKELQTLSTRLMVKHGLKPRAERAKPAEGADQPNRPAGIRRMGAHRKPK